MEPFEKSMWEDFDYRHKDFPEEASERYNEQRFKREYTIYKIGHFSNKIVELDKHFELPFNSILHVVDNIGKTEYIDTPRVDENEFITRESGRKFIYHIRELNTSGPIVYPDKYILRFAGLPTTLMKFRQQQGSKFRYLNMVEEFPTNNMYLTVVNHNPLFRMKMFGRLPFFRITQQILASVFNTCSSLSHLNKHQFIVIPWTNEVYDKQMFIRSRKELTFTTVRKPNSFQYIFMMHLVNYMWNGETTSMFEKLDDTTLSQITLILKHNDKHLFLNLKTIKELNVRNIAYYKFVNQLNLLALIGSEDAEQHQEIINKLLEENKVEENTVITVKEPEDKQVISEVNEERVIDKLKDIIKPKVRTVSGVNGSIPETKEILRTIDTEGHQHTKRVAVVNKVSNISKVATKQITKDTYAEEYVNDLDNETVKFIDNNEDLTPAAKVHFKKLATKYKACKIDGVTIEKLLIDHSDISLTPEVLDEKVVGFVPDKSALSSSTYSFEKDYRTKTFKKHLAGVISSFQNKGVFLVDVKQEVVTDPLNNYTVYTCTYEDIHSKRSTVKIKMPNIDSNDRFITDGNPQVIKKQRCVLPIVKINDREVSLASNYNKTRVVRNMTKAHSFNGYVEGFLNNKDKSTADIVFGNIDINEPISYEYCMMAKRFNVITFTNKDKYYLTFDYYHRFNHLEKDEYHSKVDKLESLYGIWFGYNSRNFFFIDNENQIFAVDKKSGAEDTTFELTSLLDLLKLSLKDNVEVKRSLSEYLTIKILNAELPVIIMLAYRYGLRKILDYIGIEYYITENRSKIIVGESTIPSTESFGVNSDRVAGSDELEIIYGKDWIKPANDSKPSIVIYNRRAEQDETDVEVVSDSRHKNDLTKSFIGMEALDRPVKPRLGNITFYISVSSSGDDLNPNLVKIKGMTISVKLGQSNEVIRRVTNYDGLTFKTSDPKTLSKQIVEKAAAYLHCGKRKISMATINTIGKDDPLPPAVAKAKMMTSEEYAKMTSKLVNDSTRVGGNESFDEPISTEKRYQPRTNDIHIKFADRVLHFNRYPLSKSLIVSGLDAYDLSEYNMSDFESRDSYFSLFTENGLAANYLKGIESFYDLFIDNMTYTVLKQMHEPTNVRDLLLRCAVLLSTTDHIETSSGANHRIRGYEQFNAILYNEMAREFAGYQARRGKNNSFSINPNAVYLRIIQNESTMPSEASNPLEDIKMYSNITYGGIGGRTGESFVTTDRRFAKDDIGVLSEATADSGKVGMNAMLSFDPTITNTLGICESKDPKDLNPANVMSIHSLCMPFANTDDCPRVNFNSIQTTHLLNVEHVGKNRVRTGYERVIAHRVSDNFAAIAEKDGKVTKIDEVAKLMEVTYVDGTKNVFGIGDKYEYAESIVVQHNLVPNFKVGEKFKKQDVLTYNKGYFTRDEFTGQVDYTTGVMANIAFMETDTTLEDSTEISESLSAKLAINPVNPRVITLSAKSLVYKSLGLGDHVEVTTPLMIFEEEPVGDANGLTTDEDTLALLGDLNRSTPSAKFSGEIVNIEAYYGGNISDMHPTLAKLVKSAIVRPNAASKLAEGSERETEFIKSSSVPKGCKFKGIEFDEDTVMFIFYIKERIPHGVGDKLVVCNQLKSTVASIFPRPVTTESGVEVDMFFSQKGVNSRKTLSPFLNGMISRIMEKTEQDVIDEYFK